MNDKTAGNRMRYAKQYASTLSPIGDKVSNELLQLSPDKRIHAMKALLSCLAKFTGKYEQWQQIRRRYNLTWSTGNESLATFERFFDDSKTLDTMLDWVKEAIKVLPAGKKDIIKFNCLTGLRPSEAIESVRLLNKGVILPIQYYNPERQTLEHFRFPQIFLRRTKSAYVSIVNREILGIAQNIGKTPPTYEAIRFRLERAGLQCHLGYCRKIFASWLHKASISDTVIDLLQGRVGKSVLANHYLSPSQDFKGQVLDALNNLKEEIGCC